MADRAHNPALDGLRGIAIGLVLLHHTAQSLYCAPANWLERVYFAVCDAGWIGVDLFFALSGYLITDILLRTRERGGYFINFYARRSLRIFPLYFAFLALLFYAGPKLGLQLPTEAQRKYLWFYASNYDIAYHGWQPRSTTAFWSLAIEEHFYLIWPFVVWALSARRLTVLAVIVVCTWPFLRWYGAEHWEMTPLRLYVLSPFRFDTLIAGGAMAAISLGYSRGTMRRVAVPLAALGVLGIAYSAFREGGIIWANTRYQETAQFTILGVAFATIVALAATQPARSWIYRTLSAWPLRTLGKYSYGVYVVHLAADDYVGMALSKWAIGIPTPGRFPAIIAMFVGRTFLFLTLAFLSYHLFEKWFLDLKRFFTPRSRSTT